jgi:hypothetical protein
MLSSNLAIGCRILVEKAPRNRIEKSYLIINKVLRNQRNSEKILVKYQVLKSLD